MKVERVGENGVRFHGMLKEGETWNGELREENSRFSFRREWAGTWLESGSLWDPRERQFEPWTTLQRERSWEPRVESFCSPFQAFVLHGLLTWLTMRVPADLVIDWNDGDIGTFGKTLSDWATSSVTGSRDGLRSDDAAFVAQLIANRYYFHTRGDRRTIRVSEEPFGKWDWRDYSRRWDATAVAKAIELVPEELAGIHLDVVFLRTSTDPLEKWYELASFVSLDKRERLEGEAKFAWLSYSMEHMLRLFSRAIAGKELDLRTSAMRACMIQRHPLFSACARRSTFRRRSSPQAKHRCVTRWKR